MTGEERTAEVRKVQFSPMAPELVPLEKYLLETKCLHILVRALRTFQVAIFTASFKVLLFGGCS